MNDETADEVGLIRSGILDEVAVQPPENLGQIWISTSGINDVNERFAAVATKLARYARERTGKLGEQEPEFVKHLIGTDNK